MAWRAKKSQQARDATEVFAELVIEYKELLEQLAADPTLNNFTRLYAHLSHMVSGVLPLSSKGYRYRPGKRSEENIKRCVEDHRYIYDMLYPVLAPLEKRMVAANSYLSDRIEFEGTLAFHLSDIYGDVMGGLHLYKEGGNKAHKQAARQWKQGFVHHWGPHHVYEALFILHQFVYDYDELEDDE